MTLAVLPPLAPMLARLVRELPRDGYLYEPKWDGFRALAFRSGSDVDIRSRHGRPFTRYFPDLVEALLSLAPDSFVLDGEILVVRDGELDFAALMSRLHPVPSRVQRLRRETPALFVAFDLLALGEEDLREAPFEERRRRLEDVLRDARAPLFATPLTDDVDLAAAWLDRFRGAGVDGVVAKHRSLRYEPGKRAMVKVKHERTADCVVAGFRLLGEERTLGSLLLGLYDERGKLRHVGVASSFAKPQREALLSDVRSLVVPLEGHAWEQGFLVEGGPMGRLRGAAGRWTPDMERDWIPLRPDLVCEVAYDQLDDHRFRHPARFRRWRPDREARSCTLEQLDVALPDVPELLGTR